MASLANPTILEVDAEFAGIADELTRRGFLAGGLGSAALLGLAACGPSDSESSTAPSVAGTRQVNTIHGRVDVPSDPKRVVAVSFIGTANLLDLGVTPVGGTTGGVEFLPDYKDRLAAMPLVADSSGKVDLEAIAALHPDLIVGSDWASGSPALLPYTKLREIAPTALFEQAPSVGNWTDQAHGYADAVNKIEALKPQRQKFLAEQERIRTTYADLLQTLRWEIINAGDDGWYRYSTSASHCKVLAGAGFHFTAAATAQETAFAQLSNEQLGQLQPASAIGLGRSVNTSWDKSLTGQKLFQRLPAVKNDHLTRLKWFFPSSYGTATALLTQIEPILTTWSNAH